MRSTYIIILLLLLATTALAEDATIFIFRQGGQEQTLSNTYDPTTTSHTFSFPGGSQFITYISLYVATGYCAADCTSRVQLCAYVNGNVATKKCTSAAANGEGKWVELQITPDFITNVTLNATGLTYQTAYKVYYTESLTWNKIQWASIQQTYQKTLNLLALRGQQPINLGRIRELLNVEGYEGNVSVRTNNPKAVAWFDPGTMTSATNRTTSPVFDDIVLACLNEDKNLDANGNPICDFVDEGECSQQDKDWFKGYCCGDAPYNPTTGCQWYADVQAACGQNSEGKWAWAALQDIGIVRILGGQCPDIQIVSNGNKFYTCSQTTQTIIPANLIQTLNGKITIEGHHYFCDGNNIIECGGDSPYSPTAKPTGSAMTFENQKNYCTNDGRWLVSLDGTNKESCEAAGFKWTGTKCCGEEDDLLKTYTDPYTGQGTAGGCYQNQFIASGSFLTAEKITINSRGEFYTCDSAMPEGTNATGPVLPGTTLQTIAHGPCGMPLQNALLTGTLQHVVCTPYDEWKFTGSTDEHLIKSIKWLALENEHKLGCCPEDQCWDGNACKNIGSTYVAGEKGYTCR